MMRTTGVVSVQMVSQSWWGLIEDLGSSAAIDEVPQSNTIRLDHYHRSFQSRGAWTCRIAP